MFNPVEAQMNKAAAVFTGVRQDVRELLTEYLGQTLTPEIAASIELASRPSRHVEKISELVATAIECPQPDLPIKHTFAEGLYCRQIDIPAGTIVVGGKHRIENIVVVSKGTLIVATPDGPIKVSAGDTLLCREGTQNVVYAEQDTRWTNVFPNPKNIQDVDRLVETVSFMKSSELLGGASNEQLRKSGKMKQEVLS